MSEEKASYKTISVEDAVERIDGIIPVYLTQEWRAVRFALKKLQPFPELTANDAFDGYVRLVGQQYKLINQLQRQVKDLDKKLTQAIDLPDIESRGDLLARWAIDLSKNT